MVAKLSKIALVIAFFAMLYGASLISDPTDTATHRLVVAHNNAEVAILRLAEYDRKAAYARKHGQNWKAIPYPKHPRSIEVADGILSR